MPFINIPLDTTATTVYTSSGDTVVSVAYFCNIGSVTQNFSVYLVPSGGSANETNLIYNAVQLTATDTYVMDGEKIVLGDGDSLVAKATIGYTPATNGVMATVCYYGA